MSLIIVADLIAFGRLFQSAGAARAELLSPSLCRVFILGCCNKILLVDLKLWLRLFSRCCVKNQKSLRDIMENRPLWKLFCWATFREFCEARATMQESNREVGSYYFFYIITVNEKSYVRKLKDMTFFKVATSRFAYLEKSSLVFSSS